MSETLITDTAATTTEGAPESQTTAEAQAPEVAQQPDGQQPESANADEGTKPEGAPDAYADFTFEEGVSLADDLADDIKTAAKELNLTQEQAQKLADLAAKRSAAAGKQQAEALERARTEWADAAKADKEFGGDAIEANLAVAKKGLEAFGTPELTSLLNESGLGNHPEVIRFMYRAGKAISQDRIITGGTGEAPRKDARSLYPNSNLN